MKTERKRRNKKVSILILAILLLLTFIFGIHFYEPRNSTKKSISMKELSEENRKYIIAEHVLTTGYSWHINYKSDKEIEENFCSLKFTNGTDDFKKLKPGFSLEQGNQFVFFYDDYEMIQNEAELCPVLTVTEWTILYPIKPEPFKIWGSRRYLIESDFKKD